MLLTSIITIWTEFLVWTGNRILPLSFANATTGRYDPVVAFSNLQINDRQNRVQPKRV